MLLWVIESMCMFIAIDKQEGVCVLPEWGGGRANRLARLG